MVGEAAQIDDAAAAGGERRAHVGLVERYDLFAAVRFNLLTFLGLRQHQHLLDVGCESLRSGPIFIP